MNQLNLMRAVRTIGNYDITLFVAVYNLPELYGIMKDLRLKFPDLIKNYESFIVEEDIHFKAGTTFCAVEKVKFYDCSIFTLFVPSLILFVISNKMYFLYFFFFIYFNNNTILPCFNNIKV